MREFCRSVELPVTVEQAFAYHQRPGALQRLLPPWEDIRIVESDSGIDVGNRVVLETRTAGIPLRIVARHTKLDPPTLFEDVMDSGPFSAWTHQHRFSVLESSPDKSSVLTDDIQYRLPLGGLGTVLGDGLIRKRLEAMFDYRHAITEGDLMAISDLNLQPMKIGLSGAGGLLGSQLGSFLSLAGHQVYRLVRGKSDNEREIFAWGDADDCRALGELDAVIHLAGESIASGRWNDEVKRRIRDSRVEKTRELCEKLAAFSQRPKVLLCASATGIYGDRGEELLDEQSEAGEGFLADVAQEWEASCQPAIDAGIRVVNMRFGIILSPRGGALKKLLLPAKLGLAGPLGSGKQWWAWIAIDDAIRAAYHCLGSPQINGPVNFVAPEPVRCSEFAKVVGKVLGRPAFIPAPAFALRLGLGEMADALLLASTRVKATQLSRSGFNYQFADLEQALRHLLGRASKH